VKLAAFSVVNSVGVIVGRDGRVVRGNFDPQTGLRRTLAQDLNDGSAARKRSVARVAEPLPPSAAPENTTLTVVVVNQRLTYAQLSRLAIQTHTSMARGIQPFHTEKDGDVLYAVTTGEVESSGLEFEELASYAAELAWDAVLSAVPSL
jgi:L-aminopeptidase/D-esterase-like protein